MQIIREKKGADSGLCLIDRKSCRTAEKKSKTACLKRTAKPREGLLIRDENRYRRGESTATERPRQKAMPEPPQAKQNVDVPTYAGRSKSIRFSDGWCTADVYIQRKSDTSQLGQAYCTIVHSLCIICAVKLMQCSTHT